MGNLTRRLERRRSPDPSNLKMNQSSDTQVRDELSSGAEAPTSSTLNAAAEAATS